MTEDSYFAPPRRASPTLLHQEIDFISSNPVIDCLMQSIAGLFAVLDGHRQIIAVNKSLLEKIGVDNPSEVFGLRPGEALGCIHAQEEPHGCGTTRHCASCGAAIAIVASMANDRPEERTCAATIMKNGQQADLCFTVRSTPIRLEGERFLLLFMQDITPQHRWAALERTFLHDLNNILAGVLGTAEILTLDTKTKECGEKFIPLLHRLKNEISMQGILSASKGMGYDPALSEISLQDVEQELTELFCNHPAAAGKTLKITPARPGQSARADYALLLRILTNMLTNAFEASEPGDIVKYWVEEEGTNSTFFVWNRQAIPDHLQLRIFQRHFSTKNGEGRGIGTFSMKLFAENFLRGRIGFSSTPTEGTLFHLSLEAPP